VAGRFTGAKLQRKSGHRSGVPVVDGCSSARSRGFSCEDRKTSCPKDEASGPGSDELGAAARQTLLKVPHGNSPILVVTSLAPSPEQAGILRARTAADPVMRLDVASTSRCNLMGDNVTNGSVARWVAFLDSPDRSSGLASDSAAGTILAASSHGKVNAANESCGALGGTAYLGGYANAPGGATGPSTVVARVVATGDDVEGPRSVDVIDDATDSLSGQRNVAKTLRMEN